MLTLDTDTVAEIHIRDAVACQNDHDVNLGPIQTNYDSSQSFGLNSSLCTRVTPRASS
ncbi:hypothetical protein FBY28_3599 [Arthrobacter sp. SLBN-53]|nr:hypothetical protein FBY28_3599 [Arthrobacter sp. SLBN-53]